MKLPSVIFISLVCCGFLVWIEAKDKTTNKLIELMTRTFQNCVGTCATSCGQNYTLCIQDCNAMCSSDDNLCFAAKLGCGQLCHRSAPTNCTTCLDKCPNPITKCRRKRCRRRCKADQRLLEQLSNRRCHKCLQKGCLKRLAKGL